MDKKQLIDTAIHLLQSVDPETIEVINFDRTEYDDGSVGFSVNLTTPAKKVEPKHKEANAILKEIGKIAQNNTYSNSY